ncbi:MAG: hypothetical protein WAM76_12800, partial [Pseudolabrys sp.]
MPFADQPRRRLLYEACSSADRAEKIKRHSIFAKVVRSSLLAAKSAADVAQELKTDIRVGVIAE